MSRYIDAEKILPEAIKGRKFVFTMQDLFSPAMIVETVYADLQKFIDSQPTADVKPVVRGKWMFAGDGIVGCSKCKETYESNIIPRNFCPNCGADMRTKEDTK